MKTLYLTAVLLLAGVVPYSPAHKIKDFSERMPDISFSEIIGSIKEVVSHTLEVLGIELPEVNLPDISIQQIFEALALEVDIDWENLTLERILDIFGVSLPDFDSENITLEDLFEIIITRIEEIIAGTELPDVINRPWPGTAVSIQYYPSMVQIENGVGPVWVQMCVGAIITNFHILSAARCFSGSLYSANLRRIRAGSTTRYADGIINEVNYAINNDDISVIRLISSLPYTDYIQRSPIVSPNFVTLDGWYVVAAGWGKTAQGRFLFNNRVLYRVDLIVIENNICREQWNRDSGPFFDVTSNHICFGQPDTGGRDADIRDIGSPIFYSNVVVGIHVWGNFAGNQNFAIVASNVASYTNWIVATAV